MSAIGVHFTISKGFTYAAKTILEIGGDPFQFFCRNPRGSQIRQYKEKDLQQFQEIRRRHQMGPFLAHAPYTINLASINEDISTFSRNAVKEDLLRMEAIGIESFNLHPGNTVNSDLKTGLSRIISNLNMAMEGTSSIRVLLETMSGKGNEAGFRFEQLAQIIDSLEQKERGGVCIDLCHVYSSGYDIDGQLEQTMEQFDHCIGLSKIKAIHLNDSMFPLGSRKDRHAPMGCGCIGIEATQRFLLHPAIRPVPLYLETPLDDKGHQKEIAAVRRLITGN